jgi:hypothetical protein
MGEDLDSLEFDELCGLVQNIDVVSRRSTTRRHVLQTLIIPSVPNKLA